MGQVPPKYFLPSSPYGSSPAANVLNPTQPAAQNPQTPLLPPSFTDPGTMQAPNVKSALTGGTGTSGGPRMPKLFGRGLFGAIAFILLAASSFATTTVTGTIQNLGTGTLGQGAFVRFWLRGCGGNIPRINGTSVIGPSQGGVYFFDMPANGSGVISGTLYSTRDVTGALGGDIECGGSKLSVWYGMQVFVGGKGGSEVPIHAKNTATIDISNVTPITTNPVTTAPTGDTTYARLDGGNQPFTGAVSNVSSGGFNGKIGAVTPNTGVFTTVSFSRDTMVGSTPSCSSTGIGSGSCALATGSTDGGGLLIITTGAGAVSSGTIALTFSSSFGTSGVACVWSLGTGAANWNARATIMDNSGGTSAAHANWDNNSVNLTQPTTYNVSYVCRGR